MNEPQKDARYTIACRGNVVAWFVNESDRDICLDALMEMYPDYEWTGGQDE